MLKKLADYIFQVSGLALNKREFLSDSHARAAAVLLLVKLAQADGHFSEAESDAIRKYLVKESGVSGKEAAALVDAALQNTSQPRLKEILSTLDAEFSLPQKEELLCLLYRAMRSDSLRHEKEKSFITEISAALRIPEEVHMRAYSRAHS